MNRIGSVVVRMVVRGVVMRHCCATVRTGKEGHANQLSDR
jgi:hypothetical protein